MKSAFFYVCISFQLLLLFSSLGFSETLHVPSQYPTIQEAVDAAANGDVVLVASGTYLEEIRIEHKDLILQSESGPELTCIDGYPGVMAAVHVRHSESMLSGFTITNASGAGIKCGSCTLSVHHNIIINNQDGGIKCSGATVDIIENTISNNTTPFYGGAIFCIACNSASKISKNTFVDNYAEIGGAIRFAFCSPTVSENLFSGNMASHGGGALFLRSSDSQIINNVFCGNASKHGGAILAEQYSSPKIVNNTLYGNSATLCGGGLFCAYYSNAVIMNSIFWNNSARSGKEIYISSSGVSAVAIDYSNLERGENSVFVEAGGSALAWGSHMIDDDPDFADRDNKDFHLLYTSPCVGAGSKSYTYRPEEDMEGDKRGYSSTMVDIGADEFYNHLYFAGNAFPGGEIEARIVGEPGAQVHALLIGTETLDPPINMKYGKLYLQAPYLVIGPLGEIPPEGVLILKTRIPESPVAPYDLPMQALLDSTYLFQSLTNLGVLKIR